MSLVLPDQPARVRIAPSPTGNPHVGTAYVALYNKAFARRSGGAFILRIEDTDQKRFQADSERQILEALRWLGLSHDEGPGVGGPHEPYRQSQRSAIYREAVDALVSSGKAYRCFCTPARLASMREEQKARKANLGYDGACRDLPPEEIEARLQEGLRHTVRLRVPEEGKTTFEDALRGPITIDHRQVDDQVLLKSDGLPTYHLANVVDDHAMGITHVLRGEEWISSTPKHVLLYAAFGWRQPVFCHLPLLRKGKRKISKRDEASSLLWYREQGILPEALLNFLGLMGYSMPDEREVFTFEEFCQELDPRRLKTTGPDFDLRKLDWLNGEWIRRLDVAELIARLHDHFGARYAQDDALMAKVAPLVQPRMKRLTDWPRFADLFFVGLPAYDAKILTP